MRLAIVCPGCHEPEREHVASRWMPANQIAPICSVTNQAWFLVYGGRPYFLMCTCPILMSALLPCLQTMLKRELTRARTMSKRR